MGALGDALELISTSHSRWRTVRMGVAQRYDPVLGQSAIERAQPPFMMRRVEPPGARQTLQRGPVTIAATLWATGADRFRVDSDQSSPNGDDAGSRSQEVRNGARSWQRAGEGTVRVTDHGAGFGGMPSTWTTLVEPRMLTEGMDISEFGSGEVAGRPTVRIRVRSIGDRFVRGPGAFMVFPGWLGDETEIDLDLATGLAMRVESFVDGQPMRTLMVTEIDIDLELDDSLFTEQPPPGAPTEDTHRMARSIADVAVEVPFTLYAPKGLRTDAMISAARAHEPLIVRAFVMPDIQAMGVRPGPMMPMQLLECADAAGVPDPTEWEVIALASGAARLWQARDAGEVHLLVELDGTHVWLRGRSDRTETIAMAESLAAVEPTGS